MIDEIFYLEMKRLLDRAYIQILKSKDTIHIKELSFQFNKILKFLEKYEGTEAVKEALK